jgi:hypothetical protein
MNLSDDNVFQGLMLSDAHIRKFKTNTGKSSVEIKQKADRKAFLESIQKHFKKIGLESKITPEYIANKKYPQHLLFTPTTVEIGNERKRWYPNGIKIVPRDLKLNGEILAWWAMGDGGSDRGGANENSVKVRLYTNSFTFEDVRFLMEQLLDLGIESIIQIKKEIYPIIIIEKANEVKKFMDLIKPYMLPCFQYKVKYPHLVNLGNAPSRTAETQKAYYHNLPMKVRHERGIISWNKKKDKVNPERNQRYKDDLEFREYCKARSNRNYIPHPRIRENLEPCHYCKSENVRKSGKIINKSGTYQRFMCNICQKLYHSESKIETI